jgi:DNA polymerase-3 subunit delta
MRYQNLKSFQKHLSSAAPHNLCRVYLVAIPDDFERAKGIDAILSYLLTPDSPAARFTGTDLVLRDLLDALQSPSLLGGDPIVILDEIEKMPKKQAQTLADFLESASLGGYLLLGARAKSPLAPTVERLGVIFDLLDEKPWDKEKRMMEQLSERAKNAGKRLNPDVVSFLFERLEKDAALLESEIDKLICYVGERASIEREDVLRICSANRTHTLWQMAEEVIWEGGSLSSIDSASFHAVIPVLRSQLQLGLKITALIECKLPAEEWGVHLPKLWPKVLEKRSSQAARLGSAYFRKGLDRLFEIELLSRSGSTQYAALLDLLRTHLCRT